MERVTDSILRLVYGPDVKRQLRRHYDLRLGNHVDRISRSGTSLSLGLGGAMGVQWRVLRS